MKRKIYNTNKATVSGPYSHAVDAGDYVFLSSQTARNSTGKGKDAISIGEQTQECFDALFDVFPLI